MALDTLISSHPVGECWQEVNTSPVFPQSPLSQARGSLSQPTPDNIQSGHTRTKLSIYVVVKPFRGKFYLIFIYFYNLIIKNYIFQQEALLSSNEIIQTVSIGSFDCEGGVRLGREGSLTPLGGQHVGLTDPVTESSQQSRH